MDKFHFLHVLEWHYLIRDRRHIFDLDDTVIREATVQAATAISSSSSHAVSGGEGAFLLYQASSKLHQGHPLTSRSITPHYSVFTP